MELMGVSDVEGKAATGSGKRAGRPASFKFVSRLWINQLVWIREIRVGSAENLKKKLVIYSCIQ
jgi:hypothetical protein